MQEVLSFGLWLKDRRRVLGFTQQEVAQRAACSLSSLRRIEAGELTPSRELALLLAAALSVPAAEHDAFVAFARAERRTTLSPTLATTTPAQAPSIVAPPPLPTVAPAPSQRTALPSQVTPFIGRADEVDAVQQMLANPACGLLTLVGPGGIGKTRLALAVAQQILDFGGIPLGAILDSSAKSLQNPKFDDGLYFVSFVGVTSPEFMATTIAHLLGLTLGGTEDPQTQLLTYLREKRLLLVLDNLEHLLAGVDLLVAIQQAAPLVKMLTTSRERLDLQGEWVFDLQALPEPVAVALFTERAQRVQRTFTLTPANQAAVERICQLVGGMPLALELAANWVHALSCEEIADEITRTLDFLSVTHRDLPARQRSVRATFDYSWQLLSAAERQVLRQLTVFRGGFLREAAAQVANASLPLLGGLVAKSLVRRHAEGRYDFHELVRQFAAEHLTDDPAEEQQTCQRHATYYWALAEATAVKLKGADQRNWLNELEREEDNLEAALHWTLADAHSSQRAATGAEDATVLMGVRLATALGNFWGATGQLSKGHYWLQQALYKHHPIPESLRAKLCHALGFILGLQGDLHQAKPLLEQSVVLYQAIANQQGLAEVYAVLGRLHHRQGEYEKARHLLDQSLIYARAVDDRYQVAYTLTQLVITFMGQQAYEQARQLAQEALATARSSGNLTVIAQSLLISGELARLLGEYEQAEAYYQEGITFAQKAGARVCLIALQLNVGQVVLHKGDINGARYYFGESLRLSQQVSDQATIAMCLLSLGGVAAALHHPDQAARLFGAGEAIFHALQIQLDPADQAAHQHNVAATLAQLSAEAFACYEQAGRLLSLEQAIALALSL
ncbi:MAG: helix-turn-helix domain-containing protein [Caldilineaceae bacterium]